MCERQGSRQSISLRLALTWFIASRARGRRGGSVHGRPRAVASSGSGRRVGHRSQDPVDGTQERHGLAAADVQEVVETEIPHHGAAVATAEDVVGFSGDGIGVLVAVPLVAFVRERPDGALGVHDLGPAGAANCKEDMESLRPSPSLRTASNALYV